LILQSGGLITLQFESSLGKVLAKWLQWLSAAPITAPLPGSSSATLLHGDLLGDVFFAH